MNDAQVRSWIRELEDEIARIQDGLAELYEEFDWPPGLALEGAIAKATALMDEMERLSIQNLTSSRP